MFTNTYTSNDIFKLYVICKDNISYTVFYRGYTKIYWVHEKSCIGRGEAEPNTTFFMDPIYFRIPPVKHCITNLSHQRPFFKIQLFT